MPDTHRSLARPRFQARTGALARHQAAAAALAAGCDLTLHCSGLFEEMLDVAAHVASMDGEAEGRLARAMAGAMLDASEGPDFSAAVAVRDELLALV